MDRKKRVNFSLSQYTTELLILAAVLFTAVGWLVWSYEIADDKTAFWQKVPTILPPQFANENAWVRTSPKRLCNYVKQMSTEIAALELYNNTVPWTPENPVVVTMMDAFTTHNPGIHKIIRLPGDRESCLTNQKQCKIMISDCSVACQWRGFDETAVQYSQVLLYHPDQGHNHKTRRPLAGQAIAAIGHEPTFDFYRKWRSEKWTASLDFVVHWGTGADIPVHFYYFDKLEFGTDPGEWWKWIDPMEMWKDIETNWEFGMNTIPSRRLASAVIGETCKTRARLSLLEKFSNLLPVASYGECLHNVTGDDKRAQNGRFKGYKSTLMRQKINLIERHPFHLAFESTNKERGFVTEKVFQSFLAGTVPIYWGPPEVVRMVPPNSIINVADFDSIEDVVEHVKRVSKSKKEYLQYHQWRFAKNTPIYFRWAEKESRLTTACRICEYYSTHWRSFQHHSNRLKRLVWTKEGWKRLDSPCFSI